MTIRKYPAWGAFFGTAGAVGSWHIMQRSGPYSSHPLGCLLGLVWFIYTFFTAFGSVHKPTRILARMYLLEMFIGIVFANVAQYGSRTFGMVVPRWLSAVNMVMEAA